MTTTSTLGRTRLVGAALVAVSALGVGLAPPAAAAPAAAPPRLIGAAIPVGSSPAGVAITPDGAHAYVTNSGPDNGTVSVIDTSSNTVVDTVTVGAGTKAVAITPDGTRAYVTNGGLEGVVSVIDTSSNTVTGDPIPVGAGPNAVAFTADGTRAYVTASGDDTVSVIDTRSTTVSATVTVGVAPQGVTITPDGTRAYVANRGSDGGEVGTNTVSVIDTSSSTVTATVTVTVGAFPQGVAITPDGTRAYVTGSGDDTVSVIDTRTNRVTSTITVGATPLGVAISPDGTRAYVANGLDNTVSVIDTGTDTVSSTVTSTATSVLGEVPSAVAFTPDGTRAYVTNVGEDTVSVIETNPAVTPGATAARYTVTGTATIPGRTPVPLGPATLEATVVPTGLSDGTLSTAPLQLSATLLGFIPATAQAHLETGPVSATTFGDSTILTARARLVVDQITAFGFPLLTDGASCRSTTPSTFSVVGARDVLDTGGTLTGGDFTAAPFAGCGLLGGFLEPQLNSAVADVTQGISLTLGAPTLRAVT